MYVIGTAGHIDHGKSTLIQALTGSDPDRLKEEKERGMTIDLGFGFLPLPSGREAGVVDVPGHHRFMRNMLAGAGGIDLALLVVAASDSWMPQTQEHVDILDLLHVPQGIIVLTKTDLVDEAWIELVTEDVRERVQGTFLADAPMVQTAAPIGKGLDALKAAIDDGLARAPKPRDIGRPRLWIDRVFTIKGSGTVVTGTLLEGAVTVDDELEVVPGDEIVRVRGIQLHNRAVDAAPVGGRVALNIAGMAGALHRGDALAAPGCIEASHTLYVAVRTTPGLKRPLAGTAEMKLYVGTAERLARVTLLDADELGAGEEALAVVKLDQPCAVQWQDRFVLRDPAHLETIGGGVILDPRARPVRGRDRRFRREDYRPVHRVLAGADIPEILDVEVVRRRTNPAVDALLSVMLTEHGWLHPSELPRMIPADDDTVREAIKMVLARGEAIHLSPYIVQKDVWDRLKDRIHDALAQYHSDFPLRLGAPRETIRSNLDLEWRFFDEVIARCEEEGLVRSEGARVRLSTHDGTMTEAVRERADRLLALLRQDPHAPPSFEALIEHDGGDAELLGAMADRGMVVKINEDLVFAGDVFAGIKEQIIRHIETEGEIDVAALRDVLGTTRKYALPLLEHLDQVHVTKRVGDRRVLGPRARES